MVGAPRQLAVLALLSVSACAPVGPNYKLPDEAEINAPAARGAFVSGGTATSGSDLPNDWWKLFDDPRLNDLIARALAANTDLRVAQANLERADALLAKAKTGAELDEHADLETSYAQRSAEEVLQHTQPPERQIYNGGISVSYDLDLFGGISRGIEAAQADAEAVAAARDLVKVNVAADTTRAYAELCNAGHQIDVVQRLILVQQDDVRLTGQLIRTGRTPSFEGDRQQSLLSATRARLPALDARRRNAAYRISTLLGQPPALFDRNWLNCHLPLQLRRLLPVGDGAALLKRRPDVRAAERRLAGAVARIGVATADLYPDIKLGASIGSTGAGADFLSPLTNRFGVGPAISWNLHRSAVRANIEQSEAFSRGSLAAFDGTVLAALREVETALNNYAADLGRFDELKAARDNALRVSTHIDSLRRGGRIGGLAALDAERAAVAAEQAVTDIETTVNADQIAIFLALGGGWN